MVENLILRLFIDIFQTLYWLEHFRLYIPMFNLTFVKMLTGTLMTCHVTVTVLFYYHN